MVAPTALAAVGCCNREPAVLPANNYDAKFAAVLLQGGVDFASLDPRLLRRGGLCCNLLLVAGLTTELRPSPIPASSDGSGAVEL